MTPQRGPTKRKRKVVYCRTERKRDASFSPKTVPLYPGRVFFFVYLYLSYGLGIITAETQYKVADKEEDFGVRGQRMVVCDGWRVGDGRRMKDERFGLEARRNRNPSVCSLCPQKIFTLCLNFEGDTRTGGGFLDFFCVKPALSFITSAAFFFGCSCLFRGADIFYRRLDETEVICGPRVRSCDVSSLSKFL